MTVDELRFELEWRKVTAPAREEKAVLVKRVVDLSPPTTPEMLARIASAWRTQQAQKSVAQSAHAAPGAATATASAAERGIQTTATTLAAQDVTTYVLMPSKIIEESAAAFMSIFLRPATTSTADPAADASPTRLEDLTVTFDEVRSHIERLVKDYGLTNAQTSQIRSAAAIWSGAAAASTVMKSGNAQPAKVSVVAFVETSNATILSLQKYPVSPTLPLKPLLRCGKPERALIAGIIKSASNGKLKPEAEAVADVASSDFMNYASAYAISPEDAAYYGGAFDVFADERAGKVAPEVYLSWLVGDLRLPWVPVAAAWNLTDLDGDGFLDRAEFAMAAHLVLRFMAGAKMPLQLPVLLIQPTKRTLAQLRESATRRVKTVFISYRWSQYSETLSRVLKSALLELRYVDVFLDVQNLGSGEIHKSLQTDLQRYDAIVPIIAPGCYDRCTQKGDAVRQEIDTALALGKVIVPVFHPEYFKGTSHNYLLPTARNKIVGGPDNMRAYQLAESARESLAAAIASATERVSRVKDGAVEDDQGVKAARARLALVEPGAPLGPEGSPELADMVANIVSHKGVTFDHTYQDAWVQQLHNLLQDWAAK